MRVERRARTYVPRCQRESGRVPDLDSPRARGAQQRTRCRPRSSTAKNYSQDIAQAGLVERHGRSSQLNSGRVSDETGCTRPAH